ncbi:hypothetical protein PPL_03251 [Heterostelium album PN500]|uniref:Uncharacterized protein n=1 Tax=Heterostelium pallidum (strain ATCC 26659 / Pp 5 / PN500) TaxID=670386 RepID=D3B4C9_HETP5|nr:hypothetical protein PPL_03251 [Heterostelium album PN500]EFA84177.1 hypothetical protein PPL_03251 [Heterostelium album PN500]|eukprot:XP_020436294.1 hypothetical protein PPL_03251 [Heterostelium album PN500]
MNHNDTPIPMGGKAIPAGMEADADWMNQPIVETPTVKEDYGEEYNTVEKLREELGNLKKLITNLATAVEGVFRCQALSEDPATSEAEKNKLASMIPDQINKRDKAIEQIEKVLPIFENTDYVSYKQGSEEVITISKTTFKTKEDNFNFGTACKKLTTNIFRDQKTLLDKMKAIKKAKSA